MPGDFRRGALAMVPFMLPAVPFGILIGVAVADHPGIPNLAGWAGAPIVLAGASHLTAITLLAEGSSAFAAALAGMIVNARFLMYSAALVPRFRCQPRWFRVIAPYFLVDQLFALASTYTEETESGFRRRYMGGAMVVFVLWTVAVASGVALGPIVPNDLDLGFLVPLMFTGLLIPTLNRRPGVVAALVAAGITAGLSSLPNRGGLLIGALMGAAAGLGAERMVR